MALDVVLFTLLHILVFVYWLGGDLGAFYSSRFLIKEGVPAGERLFAARIVNDVDMAPRTALIAAAPTGLALAQSKGWIDIGWPLVLVIAGLALVWLVVAWRLHHASPTPPAGLKRADQAIRYFALFALTGWGVAGLLGQLQVPVFLSLKALILAGCIALGLVIRVMVKPLGPALMGLTGPDAAAAEKTVADILSRARLIVLTLWTLLLAAATLGLWVPTSF